MVPTPADTGEVKLKTRSTLIAHTLCLAWRKLISNTQPKITYKKKERKSGYKTSKTEDERRQRNSRGTCTTLNFKNHLKPSTYPISIFNNVRSKRSQRTPLARWRRTRRTSFVRLELAEFAGERVRSAERAQRLAAHVAECRTRVGCCIPASEIEFITWMQSMDWILYF